ncbi:hypothetical protein HPB52_001825 [Rhipicephalus sanguineus]|uniref:Reverse transcriptase domain-containing protein n=1 Tax=Rhipicephalus sanguineus TaxID=34632 RepID=A0A9D4PAW3_RHISA|nr:hypothetical protein HPB52_001825 [Rhipicephalus sanguineus]
MEAEVEGVEISLEEWTDESWTPPQGFRAQAKRHQALKQQAQMKDAQASKAPQVLQTPRPPPELKRHPLPRLPSHTYHIVGRPKTPIDLTRTSPGDLQTALPKAASLPDLDPANRDQICVHARNNIFTVSVATTDQAIAYQRITSVLLEDDRQIEEHMYAPPPDDAIRGISFYAHTFPTDEETLKDLQDSNPDYQILCSGLNGQLGNKKTWHLLRHILDPDNSEAAARHRLKRLVHRHPGSDADLLTALADKYINHAHQPAPPLPPYEGKPNPTLDADITEAEVYAAILKLRTTSAPRRDRISNKTIRNLDSKSVTALTEYFNDCRHAGSIPEEWEHAKIVFIPKPGKKTDVSNLRPISLTSCLGKLFEHVVLARLEALAEEQDLFPPTMLGFRAHLSPQDALVQIHHDLLKDPVRAGTRALLGIDLRKAFDNVTHEAIAQHLAATNPEERTPHGAVLSPFLFNLVMNQLPLSLNRIPNIRHTLYADDVTVWTTTGSDGQIEKALQRDVDAVAEYVARAGLECSVEKSELLLLRPPDYRKVKYPPPPTITTRIAGSEIPVVQQMRVFGLHGRGLRRTEEGD